MDRILSSQLVVRKEENEANDLMANGSIFSLESLGSEDDNFGPTEKFERQPYTITELVPPETVQPVNDIDENADFASPGMPVTAANLIASEDGTMIIGPSQGYIMCQNIIYIPMPFLGSFL